MKRRWTALLASILTASPVLAQSGLPAPRPVPQEPAPAQTAPAAPFAIPSSPTYPDFSATESSCDRGGCGNLSRRTEWGTCACDSVCGPPGRIWGEIDYILWQPRGDSMMPLLTSSPAGTPQAAAGVLGAPNTSILFGGQRLNDDARSGLKGNFGLWLNPSHTFGVQAGAIVLENGTESLQRASTGDPILARPFQNALTNNPVSQLVAFPNIIGGNIDLSERTSFDSFDVALRANMCCGSSWRLDALLGYRYLRLADQLRIAQNLTAGPGAPAAIAVPAGTTISSVDGFDTENVFHGVELGVTGEVRFLSRWYLSGHAKVSIGFLDQGIDINGNTSITVPGATAPTQLVGGLLAQSTNIGTRVRSEGQMIPEFNLNLGYHLTDNIRVRVGYTFLYLDNVFRPGTVVDSAVNPNLIPPATGVRTPERPAFNEVSNDYYLHGLNAGLEIRF